MAEVIQVFARIPEPGQVKTRLIPALGEQGACRVYQYLLEKTLASCLQSRADEIQIWYCGEGDSGAAFIEQAYNPRISLHSQQGMDLGQRMYHALESGLQEFERVVLVGCDCPALSTDNLDRALSGLNASAPVALGPARDGGYYLIGATGETPDIFDDMPWGTEQVLTRTRQRLEKGNYTWFEVDELQDVDEPFDLEQLGEDCLTSLLPGFDQELIRKRCCLDLRSSLPTSC